MQRPLYDIRHQLDNLARAGKAMVVSIPTDAVTGTATNIDVPVGQTFVITKLYCQGHATHDSTDTSDIRCSLLIDELDSSGAAANYVAFRWPGVHRVNAIHAASTPTELSAIPDRPICWEPAHPIIVPSKGSAYSLQTSATAGGFALYGYMLSNGDAATLGLETSTLASNASGRRICYAAIDISSTDTEIAPARTGYSIKILDVSYRSNPRAHTLSTFARIYENVDNAATYSPGGGDQTVFLFSNDNPDVSEVNFSPGIYLTSGTSLRAVGSGTAAAMMASINVIFEYVPDRDIPRNHWWVCAQPVLPTPATGTIGTGSLVTAESTTLSLYYPYSGDTKTIPNKGLQHVVEGVLWSLQKDEDATSDHVVWALTTGTAGGNLGLSSYALTQTNYLITPIMMAGGHNMNHTGAIDELRVPCPKDTGIVMVDSMAVGADLISTPSATGNNILNWAVTAWGETVPATYGIWHFKGSAS